MLIYENILREFQKQKVKYVVVGGIAVNLLGSLRSTADIDILAEMTGGNLRKIIRILQSKGYRSKQPVDPMCLADKTTRQEWISKKNMKAFNFYKKNSLNELDIIIDSPVKFEKAIKTCQRFKCGDITIPVISIDNLIKMKTISNRPLDKIDLEVLRAIKKMRSNK
jgi:predicted nucleotidyltransferase